MKCPKCHSEILDDSRFCSKCGTPIHPSEEIFISQTRTILRPMKELLPGTTLAGKYKIIEVSGRGGMGIVYKAEDTKLKRNVALKFLPPELIQDEEAKERFVLEAQAAAALSHPNICTIHEIDEEEDRSFIAMEYVEGQTLRAKIEKGPLELDEALDISIQVAEGLEEAHKKGIIHRDIKSANIMVTEKGQTKVMDFGLAKVKGGTLLTREGTTLGTVAYMSPEQARGEEVDNRSDIWSLGVVMYEMLSGQLPFIGDREASVLYSVVHEEPKPLKAIKHDIPPEMQQIIYNALKKRPESRYSSAAEMLKDLKKYQDILRAEELGAFNLRTILRRIRRPRVAIPAICAVIAISFAAVWFFSRQAKIRWAREQAIPEIEQLVEDGDWRSAYKLAKDAEQYIPKDSRLISLWPHFSMQVIIKSDPLGAKVYWKFYTAIDEDWEYLGQTPIDNIRFPSGYSRLRFEKEGFRTVYASAYPIWIHDKLIKLDEEENIPDEMVRILGGEFSLNMPGLDNLTAVQLDDYLIDKYEVTNKEFKRFVESGGYEKREYWKYPFVKDGRILTWDEAMAVFKDKTGRTGPATWEVGDYPNRQDNYPVTGLSWYEAAAYAEFAGKNLPTIYHWNVAADTAWLSSFIIPLSNFDDQGPASVGTYEGISTYGIYDMAGNVREWCWNKSGNQRFILGGGWNDQTYMFNDAFVQPSFDRSFTNGFRCIKYLKEDKSLAVLKRSIELPYRDFMKEEPVSDEIFRIYKNMYAYDKTELNAVIESSDSSAKDWIKEKISFDAAYGKERVTAYLFIPKTGYPPYQTVVYFPGSGAIHSRTSESLEIRTIDYFLKSGRAVMYPIYKSTYERGDDLDSDYPNETNFWKEHVIMWVKDLSRSIDYLEIRTDIDTDKLAYYGASWGAAIGPIMTAVEKRFKASILRGGGIDFYRALPGVDAFNFVSRVKIPVLMLNGRYDHFFPVETSQVPMFQLFGTPPEHKRHKIFESGHLVPRDQLIREALDWLDMYLGPVE